MLLGLASTYSQRPNMAMLTALCPNFAPKPLESGVAVWYALLLFQDE